MEVALSLWRRPPNGWCPSIGCMTGLRIDSCRLLIKTVTKVWLRFSLPNLKQLFEPRQSAFNGPMLVEQHKAFTAFLREYRTEDKPHMPHSIGFSGKALSPS